MAIIERPNRDMLSRALDIYRDTMRSFIVQHLEQGQGKQAADLIASTLCWRETNFRWYRLYNDIEAAIDINDFPILIKANWSHAEFRARFDFDKAVQSRFEIIADARNKWAHPDTKDIDAESAQNYLFHIAEMLGRINAHEEKSAVEILRAELSNDEEPIPLVPSPEPALDSAWTIERVRDSIPENRRKSYEERFQDDVTPFYARIAELLNVVDAEGWKLTPNFERVV